MKFRPITEADLEVGKTYYCDGNKDNTRELLAIDGNDLWVKGPGDGKWVALKDFSIGRWQLPVEEEEAPIFECEGNLFKYRTFADGRVEHLNGSRWILGVDIQTMAMGAEIARLHALLNPTPELEEWPIAGETCWVESPSTSTWCFVSYWDGSNLHLLRKERGLIHRTQAEAIASAKARCGQ